MPGSIKMMSAPGIAFDSCTAARREQRPVLVAQTPFPIGKSGQRMDVTVTVSVGVSSLKRGADTVEALMKRADLALYEAKTGGRNRVVAKAA